MILNTKNKQEAIDTLSDLKDKLSNELNIVLILTTKEDIKSTVIYKSKQKFVSSAKDNISLLEDKECKDFDYYKDLINNETFISLRLFDFNTYNELIDGHKNELISSNAAAEFFTKYRSTLENLIFKK